MKKIYFFLLGIVISCAFQTINAQQIDRIQRGQRGYVPPARLSNETYIETKDPYREANIILPKCIEEFELDAFEKEVLKNMLIKKFENQNVILSDKNNNRETRRKKMLDLDKDFYKELSSILTAEEIEQFKVMDFVQSKEVKKKKKKNRRKNRKT
ncbi:MAG: hypothetical protein DRI75_04325 [Bacteroidetes bacterium]|nr:MAG: hypothetical protein DRI75_04325 [Bacteroidota bacterium]